MATLLTKIDQERSLDKVTDAVERAKSCRISLAADAPRAVPLRWLVGRLAQESLILLKPGQSVIQPIDKVRAWFGPFDLFKVYEETRDEKKLSELREIISTESARYLSRYGYPMDHGVKAKVIDLTPSGPHRSPDVTITVLNADGTEDAPVRLYEIYGLGEFDEHASTFVKPESEAEIKARFEAQLREKDEQHAAEIAEFKRNQAEIAGIVKGFIQGTTVAAKATAAETPA